MADLYNHYNGVEPGSITSATASLRQKVQTSKSKLSSFQSSLSDDIWKASAKQTLLTAFKTIDGEVCTDILDKLDKADQIAGYITQYNEAKEQANGYSESLRGSTKDTPQSSIDSWRQGLSSAEQTMRDCVSNINGLL